MRIALIALKLNILSVTTWPIMVNSLNVVECEPFIKRSNKSSSKSTWGESLLSSILEQKLKGTWDIREKHIHSCREKRRNLLLKRNSKKFASTKSKVHCMYSYSLKKRLFIIATIISHLHGTPLIYDHINLSVVPNKKTTDNKNNNNSTFVFFFF